MKYWKRVDGEGKTTTVESYSHNLEIEGAVEITEGEFSAFIASLPPPPEPALMRDKFDDLIAKLKANGIIT